MKRRRKLRSSRESRQEDEKAKSSFLLQIYVYLMQKIKTSEINVFVLFVSCEVHRIGLIGITLWPGFGTEV
jgi:hypothetical protein